MSKDIDRDQWVYRLYEQLLEIEQRLIPVGMHVFGRASGEAELADMLRMVASFDRPEHGTRSLPDLISAGLDLPAYTLLLEESVSSEERLQQRERVESIARMSIAEFISAGPDRAAQLLAEQAAVSLEESKKIFAFLARIREQLGVNVEMDSLMRALRGEYIEPGPGADIIQNPDILPTGRNTHAINPYQIPSPAAVQKSKPIVAALLDRHFKEQGRYPESIAMILWGMDNIKTQGESVAQALWLLGVLPRRDSLNRATEIDVIALEQLGRPRIDVVMTVSGIFRDLFGPSMALLDQAVRAVASLDEPDAKNFVKRHVNEQMVTDGCSFEDAVIRVFSNAAGIYGTNVNFMILDSQWEKEEEIGDLFVTRKCFAYGRGLEGREARKLLDRALERVEATYQNIDTAEIGITDVDHYFEYLGGITRAVESRSGVRPKVYLSDTLSPGAKIRSLDEVVRLETRAKTLNPKWYEGMLKHGFRGVAEIESHVTNTFGWSATTSAVDNWVYDEVARTYILDEQMLNRLRELNPHSTRNLIGRMLEAQGRGFWIASDSTLDRLRELFHNLEDELEGVR
jgi:magnesium chelatase subunit H